MTKNSLAALLLAGTVVSACGGEKTEAVPEQQEAAEAPAELVLDSTDKRLSYMVGTNIARQFKRDEVSLDFEALQQGVDDILTDAPSRLTDEQIRDTISEMQAKVQERQQALLAEQEQEKAAAAEKNKTEGAAYLAENGAKEGVVTTESGLQYREITSGEGETPKAEDTVSVHYKGTLIDGTEFDSSYTRGEPATFPVQGVIPGWVEALQLMQVGDKWELTIPSDLAYGPGGTGSTIGPNATLVFEVELLEIVKPEG